MKYKYYKELQQEVTDGYVDVVKHPTLPLYLYNYSVKTQFEGEWNKVRLQCRGLILDVDGEIVAWCFSKFFNYEELGDFKPYELIPKKNIIVPKDKHYHLQDKVDGSLGILFNYNGEWMMSTRGSFLSDQAQKGLEIFNKKYQIHKFNPKHSYLCEIIYPNNRIVVDYKGEEKLIFLTAFVNDEELTWNAFKYQMAFLGCVPDSIVNNQDVEVDQLSFQQLKDAYKDNHEGYVVRGYPSNFRYKIKFEEYVRLHSLMTRVSAVDIWECLKNGDPIEKIIANTPDEFYDWVKDQIKELDLVYSRILVNCLEHRDDMYVALNYTAPRKEYAAWIQQNVKPRYQGIVFAMLDDKDPKPYIWKLCKPTNKTAYWNVQKV